MIGDDYIPGKRADDEPVHETFHKSAELLIHYKSGEKLETVRAGLIGGRLEATP